MLCITWKDNNIALLISNYADPKHLVERNRRRPKATSTKAKTSRAVFGSEPRKMLMIPKPIDDYNHLMDAVDTGDQLQSYNHTGRAIRRGGWHALWNYLLNTVLVNYYLLSRYSGGFKS